MTSSHALLQSNNKKEAEKLVKNIIKVVIKLGVLYRNGQFGPEEMKLAERFKVRQIKKRCLVVLRNKCKPSQTPRMRDGANSTKQNRVIYLRSQRMISYGPFKSSEVEMT